MILEITAYTIVASLVVVAVYLYRTVQKLNVFIEQSNLRFKRIDREFEDVAEQLYLIELENDEDIR